MILVKVVTQAQSIPRSLNLGSDPAVSKDLIESYFYFKPIGLYVHPSLRTLTNQVLQELTDFTRIHGKKSSYETGCLGPLCRRANRDYTRTYHRRKSDRKDSRQRLRPHYESVDPLLQALDHYAKHLATASP